MKQAVLDLNEIRWRWNLFHIGVIQDDLPRDQQLNAAIASAQDVRPLLDLISNVLEQHRESDQDYVCAYDGFIWPCPTWRMITGEQTT